MGRGDQFQQPRFTVPMPAEVKTWPFPKRTERPICSSCDRPVDFCECKFATGTDGFSSPSAALAALAVAAFLLFLVSFGGR